MARIAGVDLPRTKRIEIGLTYIFGIGRTRANGILKDAGVSPDVRVKDLSEDDVRKITRVIEDQGRVEGDLRKEVSMNIKWLMDIGCYRGHCPDCKSPVPRRSAGFPSHGDARSHPYTAPAAGLTSLLPTTTATLATGPYPDHFPDSRTPVQNFLYR